MEVTATINLDEYRKVSDDIKHYIGLCTIGISNGFTDDEKAAVAEAFHELVDKDKTGDWFYSGEVNGKKFFLADNGEMGYTLMLPEEY